MHEGRHLVGRAGRVVAVAIALAVALGLVGCGRDDHSSRASTARTVPSTSTTTTTEATTTSSSAVTTTTVAGARRSSPAKGARGTAAGPATSPSTTFAAPGRYRYATTGTFSSLVTGRQARNGEVALVVDPPTGRDQRSVRQSQDRTVEQVLRLQDDGAYIVALIQTSQGVRKEFRPDPPALALPFRAPVGKSWSWHTTSTDGRTTVDTSLRITGTGTLDVGGEAVPVVVVEAAITTGGDVVSTGTQKLWISERYRLVVQQQEVTDGRFAAVGFHLESTDKLASIHPG